MNKTIAKTTINFGKIAFNHSGRKTNAADVEIELNKCGGDPTYDRDGKATGRKTPQYTELHICGEVWNTRHTDIVMGGQCLESMKPYIHSALFNEIYELWSKYHLNGMHAGTPEQEAAIKAREERIGRQLTYDESCELLKEANLYEVEYTGPSVGRMYDHELYVYGHAWLIQDLPDNVVKRVMEIAKENGGYVFGGCAKINKQNDIKDDVVNKYSYHVCFVTKENKRVYGWIIDVGADNGREAIDKVKDLWIKHHTQHQFGICTTRLKHSEEIVFNDFHHIRTIKEMTPETVKAFEKTGYPLRYIGIAI